MAEPEPDLGKPLVAQAMAMTRAGYETWVHEPAYGRVGRLFAADALEALTVTPVWVVPLLWLPVAAALMAGYFATSPSAVATAATAVVALLLWSLTEYALHRLGGVRRGLGRSTQRRRGGRPHGCSAGRPGGGRREAPTPRRQGMAAGRTAASTPSPASVGE